jgi:hypothetical protein
MKKIEPPIDKNAIVRPQGLGGICGIGAKCA